MHAGVAQQCVIHTCFHVATLGHLVLHKPKLAWRLIQQVLIRIQCPGVPVHHDIILALLSYIGLFHRHYNYELAPCSDRC